MLNKPLKSPINLKIWQKWPNFAKSGHTEDHIWLRWPKASTSLTGEVPTYLAMVTDYFFYNYLSRGCCCRYEPNAAARLLRNNGPRRCR